MDIMNKYSFLFALSILFLSTADTQATNTVTVTNNGSSKSETHVRIETDGEVNSFDSTDGEEVDWTSDDGKSTVKINTKTTSTSTPTPTSQAKPSMISPTDDVEEDKTSDDTPKDPSSQNKSFSLSDFFKGIFSFFGFGKK